VSEVWTYVGCHQRFVKPDAENPRLRGDQYVYIALEQNTKMVMAWHVGKRDLRNTQEFIGKVRQATSAKNLFDVSTDAFPAYDRAIDGGLYDRANHAQIVKLFSHHVEEGRERYKPAKFVAIAKDVVSGMPDLDRATTSHVERKNGSLRQWCKRLTHLTYAYSKKWEHLNAALALHFAYYSFCRVHSSLRVTPCMEAKITDRIWTLRELLTSH
jgi:IS1 family transposase